MDRKVLWQWLQKEFRIPRDLLKISLWVSIVANMVLLWWIFEFVDKSNMSGFEAELIAASIGNELAKTDFHSGRPRYLRINHVESGARATWQVEKTQETHEGLNVWEWRCTDFHPSRPLTHTETFVEEYNRTINNLRTRTRTIK